jgi:proliferating cell nuclear antigen
VAIKIRLYILLHHNYYALFLHIKDASSYDLRRSIATFQENGVSDHVIFGVSDEGFYMEAKGDIDSLRLKIPSTELLGMKPGKARSLFSLDYLKNMSKAIGKSNEVTLELGIDYPLKVIFKLGQSSEVSYLLAPRIEQE